MATTTTNNRDCGAMGGQRQPSLCAASEEALCGNLRGTLRGTASLCGSELAQDGGLAIIGHDRGALAPSGIGMSEEVGLRPVTSKSSVPATAPNRHSYAAVFKQYTRKDASPEGVVNGGSNPGIRLGVGLRPEATKRNHVPPKS